MPYNSVSTDAIPEVLEFEQAKQRIEQFKNAHPGLIQELSQLVAEYNQKLEAADKAVRAKQVSCGPWEYYQQQTKYDAKALYDALGDRQKFMTVGGSIETVVQYKIDKARLEIAVQTNQVPKEAVEACKSISPRYHAPDKVDLP